MNFTQVENIDQKRLAYLHRALINITNKKVVDKKLLHKALSLSEYNEYLSTLENDTTGNAYDYALGEIPSEIEHYYEKVLEGDKYTRLAKMHRRSRKYDASGRTASTRFEHKAEACYEAALMELVSILDTNQERNPNADLKLSTQASLWLDRDVDVELGNQPATSIESMPRLRNSTSKYTLNKIPKLGVRKQKFLRDFVAVTDACLAIFSPPVDQRSSFVSNESSKLQRLLSMTTDDPYDIQF